MKRDVWSSKMGFVLASIGAAVGLGNIWRFPYIASGNGGIWFLVPYLVCLALVGIPLFLLEAGQGYITNHGFFQSIEKSRNVPFIKKRLRQAIGLLPVAVNTVILGYYLAICSWTLWFAVSFLLGRQPTFASMQASFTPLAAFVIVFASAVAVVAKGASRGIEPVADKLVPLLFIFLSVLFLYSLTIPGAVANVTGLFLTGFDSIFMPRTWYYALSQVLFSLSVGYGIMYTYGMHVKSGRQIYQASWEIAGADTSASVLAFLAITGIAASIGISQSGLALSFEALPGFFEGLGIIGALLGTSFFVLLFFAAYTSVLAMFAHTRASLAFLGREVNAIVYAGLFAVGAVSILSYSPLRLEIFGARVLDVLDFVFGTYLAPFSALAVVIACAYLLPHRKIAEKIGVPAKYSDAFSFAISRLVPVALVLLIIFSHMSGLY
ncbi:MAG: sodium-dependent transporter [Candidatus Micrarchaeia archaeon]